MNTIIGSIGIGSQGYLRSLPVLKLPVRFPTMEREAVDPTDFEPAPLSWTGLRAANYTTGPRDQVRAEVSGKQDGT